MDRAAIENVFNLKGIRALHLGLLYVGSLVVLLVYSILYGLTAKESNWLGATTSAAVIILVIRLREGFRRKDQNSSASSSEGCGSSVKCSSSADAGHLGNAAVPCTGDGSTWNNIEGINSDKSIDSGRPSLALRSSSCRLVVQEPEVGSLYVDKNLEHNSSLVVYSSSGLESQGGDSSTSTSANEQILDLNLELAFQEMLSDPRITSMLKRKARHTDRELANLLQDKGLDPNFAVMLKENGLDPMILALLQRSSLDADREHRDSNPPVTDSNDVEDVLPNHISFSEELRLQGLGKWLQRCRVMLHHVAGTPERAWLLFSLIFILETVVVAIFRPKTIKLLNATHQQFEFGIAVLLLSPVVCSILAFLRSLQAEDLSMTSKPRKMLSVSTVNFWVKFSTLLQYGFIAWMLSTCVGLLLSFLSNPPVTDSNDVEDVLPNHISFSEELRLQGLGKWLQRCRVMLHHVAGTPERAWLLFSLIFILETIVVAIFRPKTIKLLNATHQLFEFGIAVLLLSPVVCSILAFLRSLQDEDLSMTSKPRKVCCHLDLKERKVYPRYEFRNIPKVKLKPEYLRIPICLLTGVWLDGGGDHPLARIQRV
ncbi:Calpain-type cysteine protease DEK1 [Capsicum chinense]|nr:Calpain-type cysteine protease DEK1 [Capsicum chinense]